MSKVIIEMSLSLDGFIWPYLRSRERVTALIPFPGCPWWY